MKKVLSVLLLCVMALTIFASSAFALDLDDFNKHAGVFGIPKLDASQGKENTDSGTTTTLFDVGGCYIVFVESGGKLMAIAVQGQGENLLLYAVAAACVFDPATEHMAENLGNLFYAYILIRSPYNTEEYFPGTLVSTDTFRVSKQDLAGYPYRVTIYDRSVGD